MSLQPHNSYGKNSYSFSEVTSATGVKPYVLRFWESEFKSISPLLGEQGEKTYTQNDLDAVFTIKKLLFEDRMSIPEARDVLEGVKIVEEDSIMVSPPISPSVKEPAVATNPSNEVDSNEKLRSKISSLLNKIQDLKQAHDWKF